MPNYVPMEMQVYWPLTYPHSPINSAKQVLTGVVPISKVSAIPACIHYTAQIFPLEQTYRLNHPTATESQIEDKRTRREGMPLPKPKLLRWTAMDILIARANSRGWVTAKAGRPDIYRAGNASMGTKFMENVTSTDCLSSVLRALAEGRLSWAFWPPGTSSDLVAKESPETNAGIWISGRDNEDDESENDIDEEGGRDIQDGGSPELLSDTGESGEDFPAENTGKFNVLQIKDSESEEDENEEEA